MKKMLICLLLVVVLTASNAGVFAEVDFSNMTLDELMALQEQLNYAIEEANEAVPDAVEKADLPELDVSGYKDLDKGSKGDEVKALQAHLFELGFYTSNIDGDYGNGTVNAIKAFEEFNGLEQTGIATQALQAFLFSDNAKAKPVAVASVSVDAKSPTVLVGSTLSVSELVLIKPENATERGLLYSLNSDEFAEINDDGILSAKARGEVTVTITSKEKVENPKSTTVKVKVCQPVQTLSLNETAINIGKGTTFKLEATVAPDNADDRGVAWESENPDIATVSSNGTVTAKNCGACDILCTAKDGSGVSSLCHVIVTQLVTSVKLSESKIVLASDKTQKVVATVLPEDATNKEVTWISSNPSVAKVSSTGTILASNGGDCEITCKALDGSEKAGDCQGPRADIQCGEDGIHRNQ